MRIYTSILLSSLLCATFATTAQAFESRSNERLQSYTASRLVAENNSAGRCGDRRDSDCSLSSTKYKLSVAQTADSNTDSNDVKPRRGSGR